MKQEAAKNLNPYELIYYYLCIVKFCHRNKKCTQISNEKECNDFMFCPLSEKSLNRQTILK